MMPLNPHLNKEEYTLEDFLGDEFFIEWVKNPTADSGHFWEKWITRHPEKRELVARAATIIRSVNYGYSPPLSDDEYLEVFEKIIKSPISHDRSTSKSWLSRFFQLVPVYRIAAALTIGFLAWVAVEVYWKGGSTELTEPVSVEWIEKSTPQGLKSTLRLADGTQVTLNSESQIRFPRSFDSSLREIHLQGEAFLEVKEETRPFIVWMDSTAVEVLGTSFNIKEGPHGAMSVALVSGKVKVSDKRGNQIYLEPSEMVSFSGTGDFVKVHFDEKYLTAWKDRILFFKNSGPEDVADRISRWYGVSVEVVGPFPQNWKYTGEYKDELLENVLMGIQKTSAAKFDRNQNLIQFSYQNPKKPMKKSEDT